MATLRRISQGAFLLLFIILFLETESKGEDSLGYPVKIFLDLDPLILLVTTLSTHTVTETLLLSLITVCFTLLFGKVFCGWVCPLGTLNSIVGYKVKKRWKSWHNLKYYLLVVLVVSAIFGLNLSGILDPIPLLTRSLTIGINPTFNEAVNSFFDFLYSANVSIDGIYRFIKDAILSFHKPYFRQELFIAITFTGIILLNLLERRFWCNNLCPLGALLGLISRFSFLRRNVSEQCTECGICEKDCHGKAAKGPVWRVTECLYCFNCKEVCPEGAVRFTLKGKRKGIGFDLSRRRLITSALAGVAIVPFLKSKHKNPHPFLIRPPGALPEGEFLKRCVRCGECMKVCITNGLQPALLESGIEGIWTPMLIPRIGYCEYSCTLCGQVCPTGAIKRLELKEKVKVRIGLAMIDKGRCLPWAHEMPCIVCEEVCPTPKKAIWLKDTKFKGKDGKDIVVRQPSVDPELCIGCGICETKCPVIGQPAIYVVSVAGQR